MAGLFLATLALGFPPWRLTIQVGGTSERAATARRLILLPPSGSGGNTWITSVGVSWDRLAAELACIGFLSAAIVLAAAPRRDGSPSEDGSPRS
ncbi:MAG TPA: hypothetical protein DEB06_06810 [Phycisphaerales bacterium]|nr:hypothetical protein [Phycisphaerales bacterium]